MVSGYIDYDKVTFGTPPLTIPRQAIGEATSVTNDFELTSCDGLFGLGFQNISLMHETPPFFNLVQENALVRPIFSIWLNPNQESVIGGELIFGGINSMYYTGPLATIPLSRPGYWQVPMNGVRVGGSAVAVQGTQAILDSGTSALVVSENDARAINSMDDADLNCGSSVLGLSNIPATAPMILGSPFLRAWFSVYNYSPEGSSVSLAASASLTNGSRRHFL
ncbi:hypothetical protein WJX73_000450 [Symbiochloris irregularis]|uniref:Peptidase A1 domain-containing protein n=1 Tax=Symbiochloris irregularis TaxID=706552 RepID=A0AAW1PDU9_9CHLO